ncbi:MAG: hypothetical protein GF334_01225 [Candidatus Altiarchaeales archaeon]|nr:hypothetical protein [Candidatus Altiarchaeales archaeon]
MATITIPAFLRNPEISGMVRTTDLPRNYLFDRWFPYESVTQDEFESVVVVDQVHLAPFVAVDAATPVMPGDLLGRYQWEVAYIRYKHAFKESDFRGFFEPGVTDPSTLAYANAQAAEARIRRFVDMLSNSVDARKEWIFTNAIAGAISYDDENVQYSVTFDGAYIGSSRRKAPSTSWDAASPTIVADLSNWVEEISDETGIEEWTMVTTQKVLGEMARDSGVQRLWQNMAGIAAPQDPGSLNPIMTTQVAGALQMLGITEVVKYTAKYSTLTQTSLGQASRTKTRFINDNDLFLMPANETLGRFASAPAQPNDWMPGKFGWSKMQEDPWVIEVGAGEYTWIDFPPPNHNKVLQARVIF